MTILYKTYTRARAAKAALVKLLVESHEVPTEHFQVTEQPADDGRFTAKVDFLVAQPPFVIMDVVEAGFPFTDPEATVSETGLVSWKAPLAVVAAAQADLAAILDMGEAGDATPYPNPAPTTEEEAISLTSTPVDMGEAMTADEEAALAAIGVVPVGGVAPKVSGYVAESSTAEGPTKRVWAIAASMPGAKRKDVIEACRAAGIAFGTARTQYQKWFSANKN